MMKSVSNAIVEMEWSIISIKSIKQPYTNDILLPARIMIVTLWIESVRISVWCSVRWLILYPVGLLDL